MENLQLCFNAIVPLLLLMFLGYGLKRLHVITAEGFHALDSLCFKIVIPVMLFYNIYTADLSTGFHPGAILFMECALVLTCLGFFFIVPRRVSNRDDAITVIHGLCHGNLAVLGLPLIANLFGENNMAIYSIMVACYSPVINPMMVFEHEYFAGNRVAPAKLLKNIVTSPFLIGTLCGILFKALRIPLPGVVLSSVVSVRNMATPLCLVALGGSFYFTDLARYKKEVSLAVFLRCVAIPAVILAAAALLGFRGIVLASLMVIFASPSATATYSFCSSYSGSATLAAQLVVYSSLLSILTLFLWMFSFLQLRLI
ncbi:putative Transporter, auxin efflux carrier (AEC) family protein [uncultured Eubacteriales bacterium]|uniref:Putative Transporter, auxin efflux carrier (AEC) family protein n=1 Tax=uncultured Eubacteriales bacterium TaxID=172733 RepID=A0A212KH85_9FIRM|nr:putative Transporter, auxin efflux carrier (AEC) family protein [uncultured Eubacteriales bacterium]